MGYIHPGSFQVGLSSQHERGRRSQNPPASYLPSRLEVAKNIEVMVDVVVSECVYVCVVCVCVCVCVGGGASAGEQQAGWIVL